MSIFTQLLHKKETDNYFLILCIDDHFIRADIIQIIEDRLQVLGKGEHDITKSENLSDAVDIAISEAEKSISRDIFVQNVVFALPSEYLENGELKPQLLSNLKKVALELDLKLTGYIEYSYAISSFLEKEEGSPPTFLLLHIGHKNHTVSFVRIGKVQQEVTVKNATQIAADFHKSLTEIKSDILPARIIIYDGWNNIEKVREDLLSIPWSKHPSFLHTPKIEIFDPGKLMEAAIVAAGNNLIKQIHHTETKDGQFTSETKETNTPNEFLSTEKQMFETKETIVETEKKADGNESVEFNKNFSDNISENFGFIRGEKALEGFNTETPQSETSHIGNKPQSQPTTSTIHSTHEIHPVISHIQTAHQPHPKNSDIEIRNQTQISVTPEEPDKKKAFPFKIKIPDFKLPSFSFPVFSLSPVLIISALFIIAVCSVFFYGYYYYPKASVTLFVYPLKNTNQVNVVFTKDASGIENGINYVTLNTLTQEVSGDKTASASGKTKVGERAKGEVVIYNKTLNSKTFPKGTILSAKGLQFSLDTDVSIASASETGEGLIFGKITTNTTSVSIGPEGNIASDNVFSIKDSSENSYTAKNTKPFSGGSSRDVTSISKDDMTKLEEALTSELTSRANELIKEKVGSDENVIESLQTKEIVGKKFSAEAGSEAKEVNLNLSLKLSFYTYKKNDLWDLIKKNIQVPSGYVSDAKRFDVKLENLKNDKSGNINSNAVITSYFIPEIDQNIVLNNITGKKYESLANELKSVKNIAGFKIVKENDSFLLGNKLPLQKQNIILSIAAN